MKEEITGDYSFLLKQSIFRIGEVSSVDGREVSIRVDQEKNRSHILYKGELLSNVSVGSYVKIIKGFHKLIGKIEKEYIKEDKYQTDYSQSSERFVRHLSVKMLGYFNNGKYQKGVRELPLLGNECFILDKGEYESIHLFAREGEVTIKLGSLMIDEQVPIQLSVNRLFASHIGIFGNTGSGKSHTLASLYRSLFVVFDKSKAFLDNARFLLFDFNGEYSNSTSITSKKKVYKLSTQRESTAKIPLSPKDILTPDLFFILASATEKTQQPFIKRALRLYRDVSKDADNIEKRTRDKLHSLLEQTLTMADITMGDQILAHFIAILSGDETLKDDIGRHGKYACFLYKGNNEHIFFNEPKNKNYIQQTHLYKAIEGIKQDNDFLSWITKFLYIQLIEDILSNRAQNDHIAPAINKLKSLSRDFSKVCCIQTNSQEANLWEDGKPLVVIDLNKVSTSMKKLIPLLLSHKYYQEHKSKKTEIVTSSLNIIIDEAHNILSYDSSRESESWKDFRLETFEEIIKEGRKFGVFLTIASQRPSDISATIISQLHNYLIHRLINQRDLEMVERAISYLDKISVESLPILPPGACVLSGIIADLPLIVQVDRLDSSSQPESQTIVLTDCWCDPTPSPNA